MEVVIVAARLLLAAFLGALIGWEREIKKRAAGFRTHIIVSVGACLIMLIAIDGFDEFYSDKSWDATKFAGQVVSGIGFLGAGTILQKKNGVSGLTTAATLWLSGAIGLAVGIGYYEGAIIATIICLITLVSLKPLSDIINKRTTESYIMVFNTHNFNQKRFLDFTLNEGVEVRKIDSIDEEDDDISVVEVTLSFKNNYDTEIFFKKLEEEFNLKKATLSKNKEDSL